MSEVYTEKDAVKNSYSEDYKDKILVLKAEALLPEYRNKKFQLFKAVSGFGCSPDSLGSKVYGDVLADGEQTHFRREDFIGIATPETVENWKSEFYIPKDLQNLGKVLDTWQEQNGLVKTQDGVKIDGRANSVWFDNWRITTAESGDWESNWDITYKGKPFAECIGGNLKCDGKYYGSYIDEHDGIPESKLEIGETLKFICDKLGCKCNDINPAYGIAFSSLNDSRDYAETGVLDVYGDMRSSPATPLLFDSKKDAQEYLDSFVGLLKKDENLVAPRIEAGLLSFDIEEHEARYSPLNREKEKTVQEQEKKEARQKQQEKEIKRDRSRGSIER